MAVVTVIVRSEGQDGLERRLASPDVRRRQPEAALLTPESRIVFVMVGLPARGKSFIGRKIHRYCTWLGISAAIFNLGEYRRATIGAGMPSSFFAHDNSDGLTTRSQLADRALEDMRVFFDSDDGHVAIFDATNTTRERRELVRTRVEGWGGRAIFVESRCDDEELIEQNIRATKLTSPDYLGWDAEDAVRDFRARIAQYEKVYEPVGDHDEDIPYISMHNVRKVTVNRLDSYLGSRVAFFLMALNLRTRKIYFSRHGESEFNVVGKIGGDPDITARGQRYATALGKWMGDRVARLWTSTLRRTVQTGATVNAPHRRSIGLLDEINAGICEELTYSEIAEYFPEVHCARNIDKLRFRYPSGESYMDLAMRLEPVLFELERVQEPVLVIAHQAVLRVLLSFFMEKDPEQMPYLEIPMHSVIEVTPGSFGNTIDVHKLSE